MPFLTPEGGLSDADLDQLIALGVIPEKQDILKEQMTRAQALRDKMPEMRSGGRVNTAAHPLEFLVQGLQGYKANKQLDDLRKQQSELMGEQVKGRRAFFEALQRRGSKPQVPGAPDMSLYGNDPNYDAGMI